MEAKARAYMGHTSVTLGVESVPTLPTLQHTHPLKEDHVLDTTSHVGKTKATFLAMSWTCVQDMCLRHQNTYLKDKINLS